MSLSSEVDHITRSSSSAGFDGQTGRQTLYYFDCDENITQLLTLTSSADETFIKIE